MREETKKLLEKRLEFVNGMIINIEDKSYCWSGVYFTGLVGLGFGILSAHDNRTLAGGIVAVSGLLFKTINDFKLLKFQNEREVLEYGLSHPENVIEHDFDKKDEDKKGGKHFKK